MPASKTNSAPSGRVTIRDVASAAGVSRQTVTRAINGMPEISEATRERVMRTVEELGYRPNRFAIDLSRQRTHAVRLIVHTLANPYYAQLAVAFINELQKRNWQVVVGTADQGEEAAIASMASQVDAIIGYFTVTPTVRGVPIVQLEQHPTHPGVHSVEFDLRSGIVDLVAALRAKGARRFGMVDAADPRSEDAQGSHRRRYFEEAVGSAGLVTTQSETIAGGAAGLRELLRLDPTIDTVLAFNDLMAMGAVQGAHALDIAVPDMVKIVGIDGISLGEASYPPLTSLSMPFETVAAEGAAIVAGILDGTAAREEIVRVTVKPTILWRESA